jgi:hypothetical protein
VHRQAGWLSALLGTAALAAGGAGAATPLHCTEGHQQEWLSACALALAAADRLELPAPADPWKILAGFAFTADDQLAERFCAACDHLIAEPWRLPERERRRLVGSGWPSVGRACSRAQHLEWLRACEAEAKSIVGRPRHELLARFGEQGGISTRTDRSYVHRRCTALKVRVRFLPVGDAGERGESADDRVETVAVYIDPFVVVD